MGFMIHSVDNGHVPTLDYLPCGAITPTIGMALVMDGGVLAVATGTTVPTYISMVQKESACTEGELIPVFRILPEMVLEAPCTGATDGIKLGDKLTIADDGVQVTATTGGAAEVVGVDGEKCRVRF